MNSPLPLVIANLKATKTWDEMGEWIDEIAPHAANFKGTVIVCPASAFLAASSLKIKETNLRLSLGSQDISRFEQGAYTGEVAAAQIADIVTYSIVGHSERRKYFGETDDDVIKKVDMLIKHAVTPILCVSDQKQLYTYREKGKVIIDKSSEIIFVYEPPSAISGGGDYRPDDPEDANKNAGQIKKIIGSDIVTIYGGSINPENARSFFSKENIDGGLVGQASIDPQKFLGIINSLN